MASAGPTLVIGGGIAGLMCARTLARAGQPVLIVEREPEVGGRVRTTLRDGFRLDHGFQVLFTAYPVLTSALDLPALSLREFRPAAQIADGAGGVALVGDALADLSLLLPTLAAATLPLGDKLRLLRLRYFATSMSFEECFAPRFDRVSTRAFLRTRGFSRAAIDAFFAPFYGGILLDRSLATSASVLLYTFKMLAEGRTAVPAAGMGAIASQLAAGLPAGSVRLNAPVVRLVRDGSAVRGVALADGELVSAARVVLACEAPSIATIAATAQVHVPVPDAGLGCATVYLGSRRPLLDGTALWLNASPDATVSHAVTISNVAPTYAPSGSSLTAATVLGAAATLDDETLVSRVRADLSRMSGTAEPALAELLAVWRVPFSQYAQPPGSVARRVAAATSLPGLFVASEVSHTSSLEGAARGGVAAADAVLGSIRHG
ncbi:MAG: FAD-dependent oxidoreductase [Gemmatimonadaceae bacterium]|nr:FAD-dependent oxidoreductase [Gemmatimonadaceae bacterium]